MNKPISSGRLKTAARHVHRGFRPRGIFEGIHILPLLALIAGFIVSGTLIVALKASTITVSQEAERGLQIGSTSKCVDATASGGLAVKFGGSACQVVVSGQLINWNLTANGPGGAWHRLAKMGDGSWLRVLTIFPSAGRTELQVYRSTDNARSWTLFSGINDGQRLVDNGFLYVAPNGDILLAARNNVIGSSYAVSQWRSTNGGQSWQREANLDQAGNGPNGLWEPYYYSLPGGKVAVVWSDETYGDYSQVIVERVSSDNGHTWSGEKIVADDGSDGRPGMAGVVQMANGQFLMSLEVCGTQGCGSFTKTSANGIDWPDGIGKRIPGQVCGPFVVALSDGRLVASSCRVSDTNFTVPVSYSDDFGASWKTNTPAFTDAGQFGEWPALYQTGPDEIAAVSGSRIRFGLFIPR